MADLVSAPEGVKMLSYGVDTLVVNVSYANERLEREPRELDQGMQARLDRFKQMAQREDIAVPTPWRFRGATLFMRPKGGRFNRRGGGGQWRWILEAGDWFVLAVGRGKQDGGFIAQVRFSSVYLWSCGVGCVIVEAQAFLSEFFQANIWMQLSSIDLCVDLSWDVSALDWQEMFVSRASCDFQYPGDGLIDGPDSVRRRWKRIETLSWGMHTSAISCRIYDKKHEIIQKGREKEWFYDLWKSEKIGAQWDGESPVWRVEFSFTRSFFRNLTQPIENVLDVLDRMCELWAYAVGHVEGGPDGLPDGWLRCVVPSERDMNRSRWPVHPAWKVVQAAFQPEEVPEVILGPIVRKRQRRVHTERAVAAVAGYCSTLTAWEDDLFFVEGLDLSVVLHWLMEQLQRYMGQKGILFDALVRKKREVYGLPHDQRIVPSE